jgi:hypothetical protein
VNAPGIVGQSPLPKTDAFATLRVAMWARPYRAWAGTASGCSGTWRARALIPRQYFSDTGPMPIIANWLATKARTLKTGKARQFFQRTARAGIKNRNYSEGKDLLLGFIAASLVLPLDRLRPELVLGLLIALVLAESHGVTIPHRPDCQIGLRTPPRHEVHSR